jgi:hypothetical protein
MFYWINLGKSYTSVEFLYLIKYTAIIIAVSIAMNTKNLEKNNNNYWPQGLETNHDLCLIFFNEN